MGVDAKYERLLKRVGTNIRNIRRGKHLSQEDMVNFGFNYRQYQKIESGKYSFNFHTLFRVAEALKVDIKEFLIPKN